MPITVACIADIHVGHRAALWPENYTDIEGKEIKPSKSQILLNQYWDDYWTCEDAKNSEFVLNLAESIEGNNKKEYGRGLVEPDMDLQADAFVFAIKKHIQGKRYIGLTGSGYHGSLDSSVESGIAKKLIENGIKAECLGDIANLKFKTGHVIWATHKGGDAMLYRSTMLDRNSLYFSAIKSKLQEDPDVLLYGHHHKYFRVDTESRINIMAPTFKFWHPIKGASKFMYTQPTIGGLFFRLPDNHGEIQVIKKRYPLEHLYSALRKV
jgi:hypothetical protein